MIHLHPFYEKYFMLASDKMYHNYSHMVQHLGAICVFFYLNSGHD